MIIKPWEINIHIKSGERQAVGWDENDNEIMSSVDESIIIDESPTIKINFIYPLKSPVTKTHTHKGPWTLKQFVAAVRKSYKVIYKEEEGIWGHTLVELNLMGIDKQEDGVWGLWVEAG